MMTHAYHEKFKPKIMKDQLIMVPHQQPSYRKYSTQEST